MADVIIIEAGLQERNYWRDLWRYRELFYVLAWRDLSVRYKQTVIGAAWAVGARAAGVDLMFDPLRNGLTVIEVNAVPGWRALASATGVDVARLLLLDLLESPR